MPAFEYEAVEPGGKRVRGVLQGDTPHQVRQVLRRQSLSPLAVREVGERGPRLSWASRRRHRLRARDLALVTRQLAVLLRSGAPLEEALRNVGLQNRRHAVRQVVAGVRARVVEGYGLATAMAEYPGAFDTLYCSAVEAGEEAGELEAALERLADFAEEREAMSQRLVTALAYPVLLTLVAMAILGGLLGYVVPQIIQVFDSLDQELPALTRGLLWASAAVKSYGLALLCLLLLAALGWHLLMRNPAARHRVQALSLRLPLFGSLIKGINSARFARTLAIVTGSGVPILRALQIAAAVVPNLPMREAIERTTLEVREGGVIHKALERSGYFPQMTVYLIANGEQTGQLEQMLERAAVQQEKETDTMISTLLALFEPLMILCMGGLVLLIVLAILLPVFELNQLVG